MKTHDASVQTVYTEDDLCRYLWVQKALGKTLRQIAKDFPGATHADIQRGLNGDFPKHPQKRSIFGLSSFVLTEACPECGEVHKIDGVCLSHSLVTVTVVEVSAEEYRKIDKPVTIRVKRRPQPRPRASINTQDAESAARTIRRKMDAGTLAALVELLKNV